MSILLLYVSLIILNLLTVLGNSLGLDLTDWERGKAQRDVMKNIEHHKCFWLLGQCNEKRRSSKTKRQVLECWMDVWYRLDVVQVNCPQFWVLYTFCSNTEHNIAKEHPINQSIEIDKGQYRRWHCCIHSHAHFSFYIFSFFVLFCALFSTGTGESETLKVQ